MFEGNAQKNDDFWYQRPLFSHFATTTKIDQKQVF
jgi:hypothetical protein